MATTHEILKFNNAKKMQERETLRIKIAALRKDGVSYRQIAKRLQISRFMAFHLMPSYEDPDVVIAGKKQLKKSDLTLEEKNLIEYLRKTGNVPSHYLLNSERNFVKVDARYRDAKRLYMAALKELEAVTKKLDVFVEINNTDLNQAILRLQKKHSRGRSESVAVAVASDWHIEEKVLSDSVNGLNSYNLPEAERRVKRFFEQTLYLVELMRHETKIDTLVLALLGDLLSGYIHPELMESNQLSPAESVIHLTHLIKDGIDFLLKEGNLRDIIVPCCYGNHSRTTEKVRISTESKNSFEFILYNYLALLYQENKKVNFQIPIGYHNYLDIFGKYTIRFHHGHHINYGGGVGGIAIPVNKAIASWDKSRRPYMDVFGHFHQQKDNGNWISNGSLVGYSPYALSIKADYEPPQQAFFVIERDHGKTFTGPIIVRPEEKGS